MPYRVGRLDDLEVPDASLAGLLSWFSLIHTPPSGLPAILAEFRRCLAPGGSVLVGFCDGPAAEPFPHKVVTAYFWTVAEMSRLLTDAGFTVLDSSTRTVPDHRPYAVVIARASVRPV